MGDWLPYAILCAVLLACGFWSGYCIRAASAARELTRLREQVPDARLLRSAVTACRSCDWYDTAKRLEELAARIEEAGEGE